MYSDAPPLNGVAEQPAASVRPASPTVLPAPVRLRVFLFPGIPVALVAVGSPSGPMFETALSLLLKNKLQLSASEVSGLPRADRDPDLLSAVFGFVRSTWDPFGMRDREFILLFGSLRPLYRSRIGAGDLCDPPRLGPAAPGFVPPGVERGEWPAIDLRAAAHDVWSDQRVMEHCRVRNRRVGPASRRQAQRSAQVRQWRSCLPHPVSDVAPPSWPGGVGDPVWFEGQAHRNPFDDLRRLANHWPIYPEVAGG